MVYYSLAQSPFFDQAVALVKSPAHSGALIRQAVARTNGSVPVFDIQTLRQRMDETLGIRRVVASLVTVFAVICIVLVTIGLHGVVAQVVGERTPEIGVRMALGAKPAQILTRFILYGMRAGAIGLVVGLGLAAWTQKWLTGMLYEVRPFDPLTVAQACAGTAAVLLISVFWPARRAAKIDPQTVLRHE
jgi:ABC-type lipoprotein release transport system permease subunit